MCESMCDCRAEQIRERKREEKEREYDFPCGGFFVGSRVRNLLNGISDPVFSSGSLGGFLGADLASGLLVGVRKPRLK